MTSIEFLKKYSLVLILSFAAIGMGVIKFTYKDDSVKPDMVEKNRPTTIPTESKEEYEERIKKFDEDYPLFEKLPYKGQGFLIDQYYEAKTLEITIENNVDKARVLREIDEWLLENKIATDSHKLIIKNREPSPPIDEILAP